MKFVVRREFFAILFLALLALFFVGSGKAQDQDVSANYQWNPVRIGGGGWMRGMAVSTKDPTRRIARGDVGEVYTWNPTTNYWDPTFLSTSLPASLTSSPRGFGGGAVAIDASNGNHVLATFSCCVFYSYNSGQTWTQSNLSQTASSSETTGERIAIDPNNGNVAYFGPPGSSGSSIGLERSLDGGATWNTVIGGGMPVTTSSVRYEFQHPRFDLSSGTGTVGGQTATLIVYAVYIKHNETNGDAVSGGGVIWSQDGGNTWTDITGTILESGTETSAFSNTDNWGNLWIADSSNDNIYKHSRAGVWTTYSTPIGGGGGIAVDPNTANAQRLFITSSSNLARSTNGGTTWTNFGPIQYAPTQTILWVEPSSFRPQGHGDSISGMYMDPAGVLWTNGGNDGILTVTPNDTLNTVANPPQWASASEGIEEMVGEVITIPPGGNPVLEVEDESWFTITDPSTFNAQHSPFDTWAGNNGLSSGTDVAYSPNQPLYVAALSDNMEAGNPLLAASEYSGYTLDGGNTWTKFASITAGTHPCVLYSGAIAISARQPGHINDTGVSTDNLVWIPSNADQTTTLAQQGPAPFYSKNGGATWTQTTSFNSASGAVSRATPCTNGGPSSYTYMGYQWGPWNFTLAQHLLVADPVTPGTFYVNMVQGGEWKSTDGGVTWTQLAGTGVPSLPHHGQMYAVPGVSGEMWMVDGNSDTGSPNGLFHTLDGGNTFSRIPQFTYAWEVALGKPAAGNTYPAIYVYGLYAGDSKWGIFQSLDGGNTFNRVSYYPYNIIDVPNALAASWDVFGLLYVSFTGNSFYYASYNAPNIAPAAPSLTATGGGEQIRLNWGVPSTGGTPTSFSLYRGTQPGQESANPIETFDGTTFNYIDTGLPDGATYYYYITATNANGTGPPSPEASATTIITPPVAPLGVAAFPGDGQVEIVWSATAKATSYNIYRGTASLGESSTPVGSTTGLSFVDNTVTDGTTYYYEVEAVDAAGPGAASAEATALPQAANGSMAQIAYATTPPALDGSVSPIWSTTGTYPLNNLVIDITLTQGETSSATWQGLWDENNLYVMVNALISPVVEPDYDSVEVYIDGNNGKKTSYTSLDWQYVFQYGLPPLIQEYQDGSQGTNTAGVNYGQASPTGGYRIVAALPWSVLGVPPPSPKSLIGIDTAINTFYVANSSDRASKLFWSNTADTDWEYPNLFGTAELLAGAAEPQVAAPVFAPAAGNYANGQTVTITTTTANAAIYYTTDGSTPTPTHGTKYTAPITLSVSETVKAAAFLSGDWNSTVSTAVYQVLPYAAAPSITPGGGSLQAAFDSNVTVTLADASSGTTIVYTTNGTAPSPTNGTVYSGPFTLTATATLQKITLKALAYGSAYLNSPVSSANYVIQLGLAKAQTQTASPTFAVAAGFYVGSQKVTISSATPGATIRYTTDGSTPTSTYGSIYSSQLTVASTTTLNAIAYLAGDVPSAVTSGTYTIFTAGTYEVVVSTSSGGFSLYDTAKGVTSGTQLEQHTVVAAGSFTVSNENQAFITTLNADGTITMKEQAGNGLVIGVNHVKTTSSKVDVETVSSADTSQEWIITPSTTSGYYELANKYSGLAISVTSNSSRNNTAVIQNTYSAGSGQIWKFVPVL